MHSKFIRLILEKTVLKYKKKTFMEHLKKKQNLSNLVEKKICHSCSYDNIVNLRHLFIYHTCVATPLL